MKTEIKDYYPDTFNSLKEHYSNVPDLDIGVVMKENLLQLKVFYDRMTVTQISESPSMSDFQFISDLGKNYNLKYIS